MNNHHILIYSSLITSRLRYIFEHIFADMLGLELSFSTNRDAFVAHQGAKLNYSSYQFGDELFFYATPLLFERGIKPQQIKVEWHAEMPIFYINKNNSDLPFDPFAASFFLISRYEEYLPHERDNHDRFGAENSLAYKHRFLHLAVIDRWVQKLRAALQKRYPNLVFLPKRYKFILTYDIDIAYAYKYKGILRNLGGYLQALRYADRQMKWCERTRILAGLDPDPYDTYQLQKAMQQKYAFRANYFFLVGDYSLYDKNISVQSLAYQQLIQSIADFYDVGIHPSYQSNLNTQILAKEVQDLAQITKKRINKSRQHYIKLKIPETYQNLLNLDVDKDYSMGYPSQLGFRAGTASSFWFYDLSLETTTKLRIFPFVLMDVTLKDYLQLSPQAAMQQIAQLIDEVKLVKGVFCPIWHNHSLSETAGWEGWLQVYEYMVTLASAKE
jgi:hypothetical protein